MRETTIRVARTGPGRDDVPHPAPWRGRKEA